MSGYILFTYNLNVNISRASPSVMSVPRLEIDSADPRLGEYTGNVLQSFLEDPETPEIVAPLIEGIKQEKLINTPPTILLRREVLNEPTG